MENEEKKHSGLSKGGKIAVAASVLLAVIIVISVFILSGGEKIKPEILDGPGMERTAYAVAEPEYPIMAAYPDESSESFEEQLEKWEESLEAQYRDIDFNTELRPFFESSIKEFLSGTEGENSVLSPLNLYLCLSMLAETADGESREEICTLLNCSDVDTVSSRASELWNANYRMDGATSLSLGNALFLRNDMGYSDVTVQKLAQDYYASVFTGTMGSEEYDSVLESWLDSETGGLLTEQAFSEHMDSDTVMALASAICYKARWNTEFNKNLTDTGTFHSPGGDKECSFMHRSLDDSYYWGDVFGAVILPMANSGGSMYLVLPDEDVSIDELLQSEELMNFLLGDEPWSDSKNLMIDLSMPKFDVSAELKLRDGLEALGVKSVFDPASADFSPICPDTAAWISQAGHAARVSADEEGVTASAYTLMMMAGACAPPEEHIEFTLDRPFVFMIKSDSGQPLFAGTVNNP